VDLPPQPLTLIEGGRVERALAKSLSLSRRVTSVWLKQGRVVGAQGRLRKGERVEPNTVVELHLPGKLGAWIPPATSALALLDSGEGWIALDKPAGMPSHLAMPFEQDCALNHMVAHVAAVAQCGDDPLQGGLVHRLDNEASGILLAATKPGTWTVLRQAFSQGTVRRIYHARVSPLSLEMPKGSGEIREPLEARGPKVHVDPKGRATHTRWRALDEQGLLEIDLRSGHRHQIRVHLASLGWPIMGDSLYGGVAADRLQLQCTQLQLPDLSLSLNVQLPTFADELGSDHRRTS